MKPHINREGFSKKGGIGKMSMALSDVRCILSYSYFSAIVFSVLIYSKIRIELYNVINAN